MAVTNYFTVNGSIMAQEQVGGVGRRSYGRDALGSIISTFDSAGASENTYRYSPYGFSNNKTGTATDPRFLWNGSSGYRTRLGAYTSVYVRARHYDAVSGRWISLDALWPEAPAFTYCSAKPTVLIDGSGEGEDCLVP